MYLIEPGNPRLLKKPIKDGSEYSLYLEYKIGYKEDNGSCIRRKETLSLYIMANPRTTAQRQKNKETIDLARKIRFEREQEFLENKEGYRLKKSRSVNFLDFFQSYIDKYPKKDIKVIKMGFNDFKKFLAEQYPHLTTRIEPRYINKKMMTEFAQYIQDHHRGSGVSSAFRRFKKVILAGVEQGLFSENPCKGIVLDDKEDMLVKDILSAEELQQLFSTPYTWKYPDIRRAFAMTCFSGIRFCDVEALTFGDVDYANRIISFRQKKTEAHSRKSGVVMPLNDTLMTIVGEMPEDATPETRIFKLPPNNGGDNCNHFLKQWTKAAGITKHITWHCGRHSFGTQLLSNGANIKVVADLLGHSSLKYVEVYVRAVDKLKKEALDSLPKIEI
ncbi:MAG: site-specific integrase [Paludibacteraceae bacterium]|nr:site-specific integrase [Paludibacteraceae bacterium]MBR1388784.1 site-specific integrase [Prevotella sp.]